MYYMYHIHFYHILSQLINQSRTNTGESNTTERSVIYKEKVSLAMFIHFKFHLTK